ncbi:MAG: serine hydrolase [Gammaproteobacteria bacterium]|nr:serine hydrolase [Gammaproteobacteria bacterium]
MSSSRIRWLLACVLATTLGQASAYPIDGYAETGIARLEGYRISQLDKRGLNHLPSGALLKTEQIQLRLTEHPDFALPAPDPALTRKIVALLGADARNYSVSVLDLSDPHQPIYAEHNAEVQRNPGSVGKIIVALALFQALADLYPDDIAARQRILKNTQVTADEFIHTDSHTVPFWLPEDGSMPRRALREGDTANLWSYLDWALSASSNAAASMVMKQLVLLHQFGKDYPPTLEQEQTYFRESTAKERSELLLDSLLTPLMRNGLDKDALRQGSFFTAQGKRRIAGTNSTCTTRELLRYLLLLEQGKLVDRWSSLEIKRLLYMTQRRIRYASSPALEDAAVYFKSGSLFRCKPEPGFVCKKYQGNVDNWMNSVAIVEAPAGAPRQFYMVALTSNVLKKNSAVEHQTFATRLQALLRDWPRAGIQDGQSAAAGSK